MSAGTVLFGKSKSRADKEDSVSKHKFAFRVSLPNLNQLNLIRGKLFLTYMKKGRCP
jgi:hypothetical protein